MKVIGIIGPKAAGKDMLAKHIQGKFGGKVHSHSEVLREILGILHLPYTRENAIALVAMREVFGPDVLINALNKRIKAENIDLEIVTGVRFQNEFDNIRSYPENVLIYVTAPAEKRYEWQKNRRDKHDDFSMSAEEFVAIESKETEVHIDTLGQQADLKIENCGTADELFAKADEYLSKKI